MPDTKPILNYAQPPKRPSLIARLFLIIVDVATLLFGVWCAGLILVFIAAFIWFAWPLALVIAALVAIIWRWQR